MDAATEKSELRRRAAQTVRAMSPGDRCAASAQIVARLRDLPEFRASRTVALYLALPGEVDLSPLTGEPDKIFFLPRYDAATGVYAMARYGALQTGKFGIPEPGPEMPAATAGELQRMFWLVPGLAFDPSGVRLGRGGGFYDRLLEGRGGPVAGVFFACRALPQIPSESHDRRLDLAVTEEAVWRFGR